MVLDRPQSGRAIAVSAAKNDADHAIAVDLGGGHEKGVGRWASVVDLRP